MARGIMTAGDVRLSWVLTNTAEIPRYWPYAVKGNKTRSLSLNPMSTKPVGSVIPWPPVDAFLPVKNTDKG